MTKTVRDNRKSTSRDALPHVATSSVATDSTAESSGGAFTPRSDSTISFSFRPAEGNTFHFQGQYRDDVSASSSADRAIPSIERNSDGSSDVNSTTITPPSSTVRPSQNASRAAIAKGKAASRPGPGTGSIDFGLGNMRISSPDSRLGMFDVATAVERVASSLGNQAALLEPSYPGTEESSSSRRRRSSSRANLVPHDVRDEEMPQDRFHEPAFQQAFRDAKGLMSELTDVLGSSPLHIDPDSTMQRLHREARNLAQFQCPSSRTVGFVGDSGVGKSSLLNSLLDFRALARTSNSGAACTCVVTEYHYHESDNFAIEIDLFSLDEIMEQITGLLQPYRHYHLHRMDMDRDEKKDFEEKAERAQYTFRAMFRGRLDSEQFLTDEPEDSVLGTLRSWTQDMVASTISGREVKHTLLDCSDLLMRLTSEQTSAQEPAVWPYIRKIKVFLKAHILSKGLVLVDLPGLRDLNLARRNITERYLLQCDEIFVICYIGRATTDTGVMSVFELARQAKLSDVGIICTKSDDIRAEEAKKDWKDRRAEDIQRLIDAVARDRLDFENAEAEIAEFAEHADDDLLEEEKQHELQLHRRSGKAKKLMKGHEFELKQYLVNTRNASVMEKLNDLYGSRVPGGGLKVFCISNTDYWEHRYLPKDDALPLLQLSGIMAIRRHCISMVASSQLRIATKYIRDSIPAILGDITLWVQSGAGSVTAERKQAIRETLNALEARLRGVLSGSSSRVHGTAGSIKREFATQLYERQRIDNWSQAARNASYKWSEWHQTTYAAFCRKYGNYKTTAAGSHNWNEEAIERMVRDLAAPWQSLRSTLQNRHESIIIFVEELIDWAIQYLDTELQDFSDSTATLSQALISRQHLLIADFEEAYEKFEARLSTLRTDALSGIRSSLIGQAMEGSYRACNYESGGDSHIRRKKIINDKFGSARLFEDHMKKFRNRFYTLANNFQTDIEAAAETHLDVVQRTLDIVRSENAALESEQDPEFRGRVEAEIAAVKEGIRRIQVAVGL